MSNYSIRVQWSEEDQVFVARSPEFSGVAAHGCTAEAAVAECEDAIAGTIEIYEEEGWDLPDPEFAPRYSGKLSLRLGASLHEQVAERAQLDGLSINSFLQVAVARYLGQGIKATSSGKSVRIAKRRKSGKGKKSTPASSEMQFR